MVEERDLEISPAVYQWTGRTMTALEHLLKVNIKLHGTAAQVAEGDIFLFNHFARFETFVPQYLIHRLTGALCRSVAAAEFFPEGDPRGRYLLALGAVPNDFPRLLPFLAEEVLRGRKVVVFPEGGMVKDRRVLDHAGHYSVYSRTSRERRKHHTGAAVVALAVAAVKRAVLDAAARGDANLIEAWAARLRLPGGTEELLTTARRTTTIVPANITFYPIRVSENLLRRGAELFLRGTDPRLSEELLIEGNILLSRTDMDIRLGAPVQPVAYLRGWERRLLGRAVRRLASVDAAVGAAPGEGWARRWWDRRARKAVLRIRDAYMVGMYAGVTVNLSHLAAVTVYRLLDRGETEVVASRFHRLLYLAVKELQGSGGAHLHRSLRNPETYRDLLEDDCAGLCEWVGIAADAGLLERDGEVYRFLPALLRERAFDEIRIENPVAVYANEVAPVAAVGGAVAAAVEREPDLPNTALAALRFDDELRELAWDRARYDREEHQEVNRDEPASAPREPYLWLPEEPAGRLGVLLVHGFTAGPAEMRPLAETLREAGYPLLGVRLKGHATSPWDLLERSWEEWLASVRRGYRVLRLAVERVAVVGFSGGGDLGLLLAAEQPEGLAGVVAVCAPLKVRDRALSLVPLVHGANWVAGAMGAEGGLMPFHRVEPENPHINYRRMPIRALYELSQVMGEVKKRAAEVTCPALVIQGDEDPTVVPDSATGILERLGSEDKELVWIHSDRHGLVYGDVGGTHRAILQFLQEHAGHAG